MLGGQQSPRARQGVPEWHQSLENAVELGRSPGELNHIAELNCAHEPARRAGQHEPHLQTPCKRFQLHNLRTCGGAAKESMAGWYRRQRVLKHPCRTPWVQDLDWLEVRGEVLRPRTALSLLLARWIVSESEEATRRTLSSRGPENLEKKEIALSLKK